MPQDMYFFTWLNSFHESLESLCYSAIAWEDLPVGYSQNALVFPLTFGQGVIDAETAQDLLHVAGVQEAISFHHDLEGLWRGRSETHKWVRWGPIRKWDIHKHWEDYWVGKKQSLTPQTTLHKQ